MISGLLVVAVVVLAATAAVITSTPAATGSSMGEASAQVSSSPAPSLPAAPTSWPSNSSWLPPTNPARQWPDGADQQHRPTAAAAAAKNVYTNQFVIQVKGGEEAARKLAHKHGFVYLNHILADFYHLEHRRLARRSTSVEHEAEAQSISIQDEPQVLHLERQVLKRRVKRDFLELSAPPPPSEQVMGAPSLNQAIDVARLPGAGATPSGHTRPPNQAPASRQHQQQLLKSRPLAQGAPRVPIPHHYTRPANQPARGSAPPVAGSRLSPKPVELLETSASASSSSLLYSQQPAPKPTGLRDNTTTANSNGHGLASFRAAGSLAVNESSQATSGKQMPFNDPSWPLMWYLDGGAKNGFDLNVMAAWKMGYTGKGIVITILDDGLEKDHPDLQANYDPLASFDINGDDADPMPRYDPTDSNRHGTRCAGEVAAVPDNNICSIGIAYNSKVGGVRMLDGDVTDAVEARSLGLNNQHIHIYSASWGPDDNGKTVDGPGELATRAFIEGVTNGRQGLGSIFVFASGNGGRDHDNCNCDGYTNSIWTLSISSATENGYVPWYIEACSSTLATTYSSGSYEERQIATTDLHHSCTSSHTGTSASAPLAAGICALVLESNPKLSWRDMQHIVVRTAKPANLVAKDWRANALGRNVSHAFGYGLMDAAAMITMAKRWTTVPVQYTCEVRSPQMDKFIPAKGYIELKLRAECANVRFLEHVQSKVTLTASRRGDLHIYLVSPHGTRSTLLAQRPNDQADQGFRNWPFMTVHNWGESPNGIWTLEVHNDGKPQNRAYLKEWTLILYGTYDDPNKHLDPQAAHAAPPTGASHNHNQSPATQHSPGGRPQQVSPPPPPPAPMPAITSPSSDVADTSNQQQHRPAGLSPHWSYPAPPLPPPVSSPDTNNNKKQPSTVQPPPISSYVTTFKTIVNPPSESGPEAGDRQQQQQEQGSSAGGKADFDIVSPATQAPSTRPPATTSTSTQAPYTEVPTNHQHHHDQQPQQKPPPPLPAEPPADVGIVVMKPEIGQMPDSGSGGKLPENQLKASGTTLAGQQEQIEGNQIDAKLLTKDYRSSGDQSTYGGDQQHALGTANVQQQIRQQQQQNRSSISSSAATGTLHCNVDLICLVVALGSFLLNFRRHHQYLMASN